ncbi:MAG TPA: hypothetical protein VFD77_01365 [Brumimicrobium sp.]|nr:hypothetical protein [Brumimicrobium sp.]
MRILLFLFVGLPFLILSQNQSNIDFEILDQDAQEVSQNGRLELGLTLPDSVLNAIEDYLRGRPHQRKGINPFVSWDIDIKAHFKHLSGEEEFTAIGFWYAEMERDYGANIWKDLRTHLPFRVRYAPSRLGDWEVRLQVDIKGEPTYFSGVKQFRVVESQYKGHVTLDSATQYLERDGEIIIPTGVNLPFPTNKNNLAYSLDKEETLDVVAWQEYRDLVQRYISEGGEYFRMFLHPSSTEIEFEEVGNYNKRQNYAWEIDQLIALCEDHNTLIQFDLMYHTFFMKLGDYHQFKYDYSDYWHDESVWPYKDPNEISGYSRILNSKTPSDMFLTKTGMRYLKQRARYIMSRWGYSTSISNVELLCEPWHIDENPYIRDTPYDSLTPAGDTARKAVYEYHKQMSSYILDSLQYNQHLLSAVGRFPVGKTNIYSHLTESNPDFIDSTWYLDNIDFITISFYSSSPEKTIFSKPNRNNECDVEENSMACTVERLKNTYGKPVLMGESDHGDDTHGCSDYQGHYIDIMRYPYTGVIGHYIWAAFVIDEKSNRNESDSWSRIIAAKDYYNSDWFLELIAGKEVLGKQKSRFKNSSKDIVETHYIIGKDRATAAGYIYNRTFNINTASGRPLEELQETSCALNNPGYTTPVSITWKPQRMNVEGLQSFSKFRILFYSYVDNSFIYQAELRSSIFGKLKLVHPILIPEKDKNPLLWYRIEKVN